MNAFFTENPPTAIKLLSNQKRTLHFESEEAALFFVQMHSVKHLLPFMQRETSLAEAAQHCKISKSHMSYWLNKMLRLGVITQVRNEKRGRHNVPIYRATATTFTVPMRYVPVATDEEILTLNSRDFETIERRSIVRSSSNNDGWNLCFSYPDKFPQLRMLPANGKTPKPKHLNEWGCLALSDTQAEALQTEMRVLLEKYRDAETTDGKDFLYKFLLVEAKF